MSTIRKKILYETLLRGGKLSKIGLSLSMIGGILFFILMYFCTTSYYVMWKLDSKLLLVFLFFLLANGGAIVGALLGFIDNIWQIGNNWQMKLRKAGRTLCFFVGFSYPLWLLISYGGMRPPFFPFLFEEFIRNLDFNIPELLIFIGGIISIIELELELRKNKYDQQDLEGSS